MIKRNEITEAQARAAMSTGEFEEDVRMSAKHVVVVLTQGWCPQWTHLDRTLSSLEKDPDMENTDLHVYQLVYDKVSYSAEFMSFKEQTFKNYEIPYVRYYKDGELIGVSNWVRQKTFLEKLGIE